MKLSELAAATGRSTPAVITLQRKYGLAVYEDYCKGYAVLLKKLTYLAIFSVPTRDIKALLNHEQGLLELLKVDSLHDRPDWFEALCTMRTGHTRLLYTGYDIGHPLSADTVQTGLDFKERPRELFDDREMGANVLHGLKRYAETHERVRQKLVKERGLVRHAWRWCTGITAK